LAWYREWFGEEYLDLYSNRDEQEARQQVAFFRENFGKVRGSILDLACGSGRHIDELRNEGYDVVGCDLSWVLLRAGALQYGPMAVARADMRDLPFRDGTFAGLVNFFTSFGYFSEEEENLRVIQEMSRVLDQGAPFLFDYLNVKREIVNLVSREEKETDSGVVHIRRWFDDTQHTFYKSMAIGSRRFLERVRAYDLDEITTMFASCSFTIHQLFGDFQGSPFNAESPRLIVVGTKR